MIKNLYCETASGEWSENMCEKQLCKHQGLVRNQGLKLHLGRFLYWKGDQALEQVVQGGGGVSIAEGVKKYADMALLEMI